MNLKLVVSVVNLLKLYPAVSAGLVNIAVICLAHFGFKASASQIVEIVSFTVALSALVVHNSVTPVAKINQEAKEVK